MNKGQDKYVDLRIEKLSSDNHSQFIDFFKCSDTEDTRRNFHPFEFSEEALEKKFSAINKDLFFGVFAENNKMIGFGMLRGWDEGYTTPSLGIAMHPNFRNQGLGRDFMEFLHNQAKAKGATKVRLKVYLGNTGARNFYESLEYSFTDEENSQLIGYCEL